jgi:hypothetical protein
MQSSCDHRVTAASFQELGGQIIDPKPSLSDRISQRFTVTCASASSLVVLFTPRDVAAGSSEKLSIGIAA